jgi:heme exporter protein D
MSTYNQIAWLPLCAGLTGLGLVLSWFALRRRGLGAGLFGAAWSLLPLAAYLTGSILMFWRMGVAIGDFAKGFAFSAKVWSGIAVAGLALVLFVVSSGMRRRRKAVRKDADAGGALGGTAPRGGALATVPAAVPAATAPAEAAKLPRRRKPASADSGDDDMQDVEEILRRRGIS